MKKTLDKTVLIVLFVLLGCNTFATSTTNEEEIMAVADPGSDPGAPIDSYILPMFFLGIAISYCLIKKEVETIK